MLGTRLPRLFARSLAFGALSILVVEASARAEVPAAWAMPTTNAEPVVPSAPTPATPVAPAGAGAGAATTDAGTPAGEPGVVAPAVPPIAPTPPIDLHVTLPLQTPKQQQDAPPPRVDPKVPGEEVFDYNSSRYEPAGFPLIGGDSDIGFEFGVVGTLTKFGDGQRPYIWNMDLLLAASIKSGPNGSTELTQQNYLWDIDIPGLNGGKIRVNPAVSYESTINQAYFGIGNASSPNVPAKTTGVVGEHFQYNEREARVRELTRFTWKPPWDIMLATTYRYDLPVIYQGSKLAQDAANHAIYGTQNTSLAMLGVGVIYDTRDNEYFPRRGSYHQIGLRVVAGFPTDENVQYGAFGAMLAKYFPIGRKSTLAIRGVVDAEFGHVPLLDLYTGGPFQTYEMIGGSAAVRGVPDGRYAGPLKVLGNAELRSLPISFHVLGQRFRVGGNLLADTGRLWSDYTFKNKQDGSGLGLKWGVGGGVYLVWGQAAVFRVEVAYSPDAVAENSSLPLGIYVEDGVMF